MAEHGQFLNAPDTYMDKIAVGADRRAARSTSAAAPTQNLRAIAEAKRVRVADLTAVILDRPRHEALIAEVRKAGARIRLITDGDVGGAIATADPADRHRRPARHRRRARGRAGGGGAALHRRRHAGRAQVRATTTSARAPSAWASTTTTRSSRSTSWRSGDVMFAATGVTDGFLLRGVRFSGDGAETHSVVMRSRSGTVRFIHDRHRFEGHPVYDRGGKLRSARPSYLPFGRRVC